MAAVINRSTLVYLSSVNTPDYGSSITLNSGETLTLDFDGTNGLLQIT